MNEKMKVQKVYDIPLVSILLACYNQEKYIEDCLKGVLSQTYSEIELIISDDCSTDGTVSVIERYLPRLRDKFCKVIFESNSANLGLILNHIKLGDMASGKYMVFLAGDDIPLPEFISESAGYMEEHPEYAMCYSDEYIVPDTYKYGMPMSHFPRYQNQGASKSGFHLFEDLILGNMCLGATSVMLKSESFHKYGGFDPDIGVEDTNLWLTIARLDGIGHFDQCLICYRQSDQSVSNLKSNGSEKKFLQAYETELKTYSKHINYLSDEKKKKAVIDHIYLKYFIIAMDLDFPKQAKELFKTIQSKNVILSRKTRLYYRLYCCHMGKIYVLLRNIRDSIKRKELI